MDNNDRTPSTPGFGRRCRCSPLHEKGVWQRAEEDEASFTETLQSPVWCSLPRRTDRRLPASPSKEDVTSKQRVQETVSDETATRSSKDKDPRLSLRIVIEQDQQGDKSSKPRAILSDQNKDCAMSRVSTSPSRSKPSWQLPGDVAILRNDTMFVCLDCKMVFNSHSPLADHILSEKHRKRVRKHLFPVSHFRDLPESFYCTICEECLTPHDLQKHIHEEPHSSVSLDRVQKWYAHQPFGLDRNQERIAERHCRGISNLDTALTTVYCLDLDW